MEAYREKERSFIEQNVKYNEELFDLKDINLEKYDCNILQKALSILPFR